MEEVRAEIAAEDAARRARGAHGSESESSDEEEEAERAEISKKRQAEIALQIAKFQAQVKPKPVKGRKQTPAKKRAAAKKKAKQTAAEKLARELGPAFANLAPKEALLRGSGDDDVDYV